MHQASLKRIFETYMYTFLLLLSLVCNYYDFGSRHLATTPKHENTLPLKGILNWTCFYSHIATPGILVSAIYWFASLFCGTFDWVLALIFACDKACNNKMLPIGNFVPVPLICRGLERLRYLYNTKAFTYCELLYIECYKMYPTEMVVCFTLFTFRCLNIACLIRFIYFFNVYALFRITKNVMPKRDGVVHIFGNSLIGI